MRQDAQAKGAHSSVIDYLDHLKMNLVDLTSRQDMSMLEAVERLQTLSWNMYSRRLSDFKYTFNSCFETGTSKSAADIVKNWSTWCNGNQLLENVLFGWNDSNFRYLLREMERSNGQYIHDNRALELEHSSADAR